MALHLFPRERKFFDLFESQGARAVAAAELFYSLSKNWPPDPGEILARLQDIEHEADVATHEIYDRMNRTFVTPFDREDIHELAHGLDDIIDITQAIAMRMPLYKVTGSTPDLVALAEILLEAARTLKKAVESLKDSGRSRHLHEYLIEINRLENAGDRAFEGAMGRLFDGDPSPLHVIKWKEIYEGVERAIDKCEQVANILESILVKYA